MSLASVACTELLASNASVFAAESSTLRTFR
jgi:hypothetical protein